MAVAEVLDFENAVSGDAVSGDELDAAFDRLIDELGSHPMVDALARSDRYQSRLLAFDARLLAAHMDDGADTRAAEDLAGRGKKRTKADAKKRVRRAKAVEQNPDLGDDLASGALGPEQLDAIAGAAAKTDGDAANADDLITNIKHSNPDDARKLAADWVDDHTTPDEHEARRARQRRLRRVVRYPKANGTEALHAEGDTETITEMWNVLTAESKRLFDADGGRDLAPAKHPRTREQRIYDALHQALTGTPDSEDAAGNDVDEGRGGTSRSGRPRIYITLTVDDFIGDRVRARMAGGGTIPTSLLEQYLPNSELVGVLFDGDGEVLWHGRTKRYATGAQFSALIARDLGCALCGAHPNECDSHHMIPYNSPAKGNTNTDQMAPVDLDCHHHIHDNKLTLTTEPHPTLTGKRRYTLRPATPDEIPP